MTVGAWFAFRIKPEDHEKMVGVMREIFEAMAVEEFPTGNVDVYTAYHDPTDPGRWYMFEQFTDEGARIHAKGPMVYPPGQKLAALCIEPYERLVVEPVMTSGCGAAIGEIRETFEPKSDG